MLITNKQPEILKILRINILIWCCLAHVKVNVQSKSYDKYMEVLWQNMEMMADKDYVLVSDTMVVFAQQEITNPLIPGNLVIKLIVLIQCIVSILTILALPT